MGMACLLMDKEQRIMDGILHAYIESIMEFVGAISTWMSDHLCKGGD